MTARTRDTAEQSACAWLRRLVARLLDIDEDEVATDQPLGELGIDSLTAAELSVDIEECTGVNVPLEGFLGRHTLADVASELARQVPATDLDLR